MDDGHRWVAESSYDQWLSDRLTGGVWARWQSSQGGFPTVPIGGTEWPYSPEWQAGGRLDYINANGPHVGLESVALGKRFSDPQNSQLIGGYLLFNLRFQYQRNLRENYFVNAMNLTDRDYVKFSGYPQAGRSIVVGIDYRY
jgi:outer membrane receptor protein involved in Fe transport